MIIELIEQNEKFELVKVGNQKFCYQINNTSDLNSKDWFCYGAWSTLEESREVFKKEFS